MGLCEADPNCTSPDDGIFLFLGDPDIAGVGVIIAFMLSAWLAFACVLVPCVKQYLASLKPRNSEPRTLEIRSNEVYQELVLSLSDSQLITGTSIMLVGFTKTCTITQYHFYIATLLAQTSFTTHQSTFIIISDYVQSKSWTSIPRVIWITALTFMLLLAQLITSNNLFLEDGGWGLSIRCIWNNFVGNYTLPNIGWWVSIVIGDLWGYLDIIGCLVHRDITRPIVTRILSLFRVPVLYLGYVLDSPAYIYFKITDRTMKTEGWRSAILRGLGFTFLSIFAILFSLRRFLLSDAFNLIRVCCMLTYTTSEIFNTRNDATENGLTSNEDEWGYGQQTAILLLGLPLLSLFDTYQKIHKKSRERSEKSLTIQPSQTSLHQIADGLNSSISNRPCSSLNMIENAAEISDSRDGSPELKDRDTVEALRSGTSRNSFVGQTFSRESLPPVDSAQATAFRSFTGPPGHSFSRRTTGKSASKPSAEIIHPIARTGSLHIQMPSSEPSQTSVSGQQVNTRNQASRAKYTKLENMLVRNIYFKV
jgi:hypothetical protein